MFIQDERRLALNIHKSIPHDHNTIYLNPNTLLFGRKPNIETFWIGSDNPLTFKEHQEMFGPEWKYFNAERSIRYRYNSNGHRTDMELDDLPDEWGLALGCSGTESVGLPLEAAWHQNLGLPVYNSGIGGFGPDAMLYNLQRIMRIVDRKPKYVFVQLSLSHRFTAFFKEPNLVDPLSQDNVVKICGIWDYLSPMKSPYANLVGDAITTGIDRWRTRQIVETMQTICELAAAKLIIIDTYYEFDTSRNRDNTTRNPAYTIDVDIERVKFLSNIPTFNCELGGFDKMDSSIELSRDCFHRGEEYNQFIADGVKALM